jgi:ABC-type lipoprotein export system ATPase subunit
VLRINNLWKSYKKKDGAVSIFEGISFTIAPGEFVALRGSSGAGKSTLLLLAGGLLQPDSGKIEVACTPLSPLDADKRAIFRNKNIGFVFQEFHLVPYLTVVQNVMTASENGLNGQIRSAELLKRFGLSSRSTHYPSQLSTGERQRTALARALLNKPNLLLADEPTGNLDKENADQVLGYFREFANNGGSVLLVTHDDRAAAQADRTLTIANRQIK